MWLCTKLGFYSIVRKAPNEFHVRARCKKDLLTLRKAVSSKIHRRASHWEIIRTEPADYRFRMIVSAASFQAIMQLLAMELDYSNFKGVISQTEGQRDKLGIYTEFHHSMEQWQELAGPIGKVIPEVGDRFELLEGDAPSASEHERRLRRLVPGIEDATDR